VIRRRSVLVLAAAVIAALAQRPAAAQAPAAGRNFGWKITGRSGAIYVVGSVHLLSRDFYPLNPPLETAYKDSDLLVEEIDIAEMTGPGSQMTLLTRGMQPSAQPIEKVLSPATMALLTK
jgi:uncharacterized protein YbaP (TraB family)